MPRTTNADRILSEARQRAQDAKAKVEALDADLLLAKAVFNAYYETLAHLEKALAPKPRKKADAKPTAAKQKAPKEPEAKQDEENEHLCGTCGNVEGYQDHFKPSPNYHPFDPPKAVRKRKQKEAPPVLTGLGAQDENTSALAVGAGD